MVTKDNCRTRVAPRSGSAFEDSNSGRNIVQTPPTSNGGSAFATYAEADLLVDLGERAAVLEFDGAMSRTEAEAQAFGEHIDALRLPGVLGELIAAGRRRHHSSLDSVLSELGLTGRAPLWGLSRIVTEGGAYRPAEPGEPAHDAVIVGAFEDGRLDDLVAQNLTTGWLHTRLGVAAMVGSDQAAEARELGRELLVFGGLLPWLRAGCHGAVVLDWARAAYALDGVKVLHCQRSIAKQAHRATRRLHPAPRILVPEPPGARRAA